MKIRNIRKTLFISMLYSLQKSNSQDWSNHQEGKYLRTSPIELDDREIARRIDEDQEFYFSIDKTPKDFVDHWSDFGRCIVGGTSGAELGYSTSLSNNGKLLATSSFSTVSLYGYEQFVGWSQLMDFRAMLKDNGRGYYRTRLSESGNHIVIGSPYNRLLGYDTGCVQVFRNEAGTWSQIGWTLMGDKAGDLFGYSVDIVDEDKVIIAVGAYGGGYTKVLTYDERAAKWVLKRRNNGSLSHGSSIALSAYGKRFVLGSPMYVAATGLAQVTHFDSYEIIQSLIGVTGSGWATEVTISNDGETLAVAAPLHGWVEVYKHDRTLNQWSAIGYAISKREISYGSSISLSGDGTRLAIGAPENSNYYHRGGAAYLLEYSPLPQNGEWIPGGKWIEISETFYGNNNYASCGTTVSLSSDGTRMAISCPGAGDVSNRKAGKVCIRRGVLTGDDDDFIFFFFSPTSIPSVSPSISLLPTSPPSMSPSISLSPSTFPSEFPTHFPTHYPTEAPTKEVTTSPSEPPSIGGGPFFSSLNKTKSFLFRFRVALTCLLSFGVFGGFGFFFGSMT